MAAGLGESTFGYLGALMGLAGEKPDVPEFQPVDIGSVLRDVISANLGNFDDIKSLASQINQFNTNEDIKSLQKLFPGAKGIIRDASGVIKSQLAGEVPQDVQEQIQRFGAEQAVASGTGGSEFAGYRTARDFGLTSLNLVQQGMNSAERWIQASRARVPLFNVASMFVSPGQGLQTAMWNEENRWNAEWLGEQIDAMPSPEEMAAMDLMKSAGGVADSFMSMYTGGAMGGGTGGGGGMGSMMGGGGGAPAYGSTYGGYGGSTYMSIPNAQGGGYSAPTGGNSFGFGF